MSPICCGCIQPVRNLKPSHDNLFFRTRRNPRLGLWTRGAQERPNQRCNVTLLNPVWNVSHQYSLSLSLSLSPLSWVTGCRNDRNTTGSMVSEGMCLISRESTQCQSFTFINNTRFIQLFQIPSLFSRLIKSIRKYDTFLYVTSKRLRAFVYHCDLTCVSQPACRTNVTNSGKWISRTGTANVPRNVSRGNWSFRFLYEVQNACSASTF